ncbi:arsenical pump membrane protein [Thermoplasma volcanium GSS1]|uniref:Arsenical pump membrane protein n=1 Tax=Thermoplasma volcanium (strain ATCC 51530 / DSM 4299 / JCM 9571 / NBRC 15438 / GSS1) TaxID=273116 RepID=Q97C17_THEVO|nr:arsenic transporter [Thermoplasma volcanium]BAB59430.1 arsenical pump membrane protein [Thermoplasma volcanium GSS1]
MQDFRFVAAAIVFIFTLILVTVRPWKIDIGYGALIGAFVSIILGISTPADVIKVWNIIWNPTFTFVAIIAMSLVLDYAGFFEYYAIRISKFAGGNGIKLFVFIVILGSLTAAFFANDGAVLVLTPIVLSIMDMTGIGKKGAVAYIMAIGFISDSSSLPFVISNLVNIIGSGYFGISFASYAKVMVIPDIISVVSSLGLLLLYYRKDIPRIYQVESLPNPKNVIKDPLIFKLAFPFMAIVVLAYFLTSFDLVPVSFVAVPAATILIVVARYNHRINTRSIIAEAPWQVVVFSLGMYIVVYGFGDNGLTSVLVHVTKSILLLGNPLSTVLAGLLFGAMAGSMNNLPSVMMGALTISHLNQNSFLIYANVIGNDIGPKFTPIGSLATLLWIYTLQRKHGVQITPIYYMKVGFIIAFPVLVLTLLSLYATIYFGL